MLIQSRKQASLITEDSAAGEAVETAVKTPIKIGGTVTGKDLPATVVIKDPATGKVIAEVTTDMNGNWTAYIDSGKYTVDFIGKDKDEKTTTDITVSLDGSRDFDATMVPVTGDTANLGFFASLLLLVGGMMVTLTVKRRREEI